MQLVGPKARRYIPQIRRFDTGFSFREGKVLWDMLGKTWDATAIDDDAVKAFVSVVPSIYSPPDLVVEFYTLLNRSTGEELYFPKRKLVPGNHAGDVTYGDFCAEVASSAGAGTELTHMRHLIFFFNNHERKVSLVVDSLIRVD